MARTIETAKMIECDICGGLGVVDIEGKSKCCHCKGTGKISV